MDGKVNRVKIGSNSIRANYVLYEREKMFFVKTTGTEYYVEDVYGNKLTSINGYTITQSDFTIADSVCTQIAINGVVCEVYKDGEGKLFFYIDVQEKIGTISYTSNKLNYYSKTVNKNELETMDKLTYYIGEKTTDDGVEYFLYTNINKPENSIVTHIGSYEINKNCFVDMAGDYLKDSNGNRVVRIGANVFAVNSEMKGETEILSIAITTFKIYYKSTPKNPEVKGMLFRQKLENNYDIISKFVYYNGSVIGAATKTNFSDAYGLSISVNYKNDFIEFQILDNAKFENFMTVLKYSLNLEFVAVDSATVNGDSYQFGVVASFRLLLATGTADNPYIVDDAESFVAIRNDLSAYYKVIQNISLFNIKSWTPIGTSLEAFEGTIYGEKQYRQAL